MRGSLLFLALRLTAANVEGVVMNSVTGAPVPRVNVTLRGQIEGRPGAYGTTTGTDGKFSIRDVAAGGYRVYAGRAGFTAPRDSEPVQLRLKADDTRTGIEIKLAPTGAVSGRVTDADGEPVEGATVTADSGMGSEYAVTDENGLYRIGGLSPRKYRVRASKGNIGEGRPEIRTDGTAEFHNVATSYPGRIDVPPGAELSGIDIHMARAPFVRVSGKVTGVPRKAEGAFVTVNQGAGGWGVPLKPDGSFEIWRLDPGDYRIEAEWNAPNGDEIHTNGVEIHVAGSNIDGTELHVVPDSDITGRLEFAGDTAKNRVEKLRPRPEVQLTLLGAAEASYSARPDDADTFRLEKVQPGRYWVAVSDDAVYVQSMRLGMQPIEGPVLDLNEGSHGADLSLVLAAATGSVSGTATGKRVILISAAPKNETGFESRFAKVEADGTYKIDNLPPGSYRIAAVNDEDSDESEDAMQLVELGKGENVKRNLVK